jgi:hypothetical protein
VVIIVVEEGCIEFAEETSLKMQLCLGLLRTEYGIQKEEQDGKENTITVCLQTKSSITYPEINVLCIVVEGIEG